MEHRIRDARRGETNVRKTAVRDCEAMAQEEPWSGWSHAKETNRNIDQGDWKTILIEEFESEEWQV